MIAVVIRTTVTWIALATTAIFIALRVGNETEWPWIVIALPVLIFDVVYSLVLCLGLWHHFLERSIHIPNNVSSAWRKLWLLFLFILNIIAVVVVCLRLNGDLSSSYSVVCIPLWIFLVAVTGDLTRLLVKDIKRRRDV